MNIQDEIHNDRLAIDYIQPYVFIREDLYQELLDTSMFPHALRVIQLPWWKKLLVRLYLKFTSFPTFSPFSKHIPSLPAGDGLPVTLSPFISDSLIYQTFLYHLQHLRTHINEFRTEPPSIPPISDDTPLNFAITDHNGKPIRVGYQLQNSWHHRPWTVDSSMRTVGK